MLPRIGIVGSPEHILLLSPLLKAEGFPVTAVWCKNRETSQRLADKFSVPHCPASFQDLLVLRDVDLVYVAVEPLSQAEVAVKALTSGKHCICVKPPSVSLGEVDKMLTLSQYYSQLHSVLECHMEFIPAYLELKKIIGEDGIGDIMTIDVNLEMCSLIGKETYSWKCDQSLGGGVLNLVGSHIIGAVCNIGKQFCQIKRVNCTLKTCNRTSKKINGYRTILSDDYCSLQLELANGIFANITINSLCESDYVYQLSVNGSGGRLIMNGLNLYLQQKGRERRLLYKEVISLSEKQQYLEEANKMNLPFEYYYSMVVGSRGMISALQQLFTEVNSNGDIHRKSKLGLSSFEDGHHVRTVLDLAQISSKQYNWVDVPNKDQHSFQSNPFWTTSGVKLDVEKPSPKSHDPVSYV